MRAVVIDRIVVVARADQLPVIAVRTPRAAENDLFDCLFVEQLLDSGIERPGHRFRQWCCQTTGAIASAIQFATAFPPMTASAFP